MKNIFTLLMCVTLSVAASVIAVRTIAPSEKTAVTSAASAESAYSRVMQTKTLRCGYINYPPHIIIDPNTKQISGITHDIMEEAARLLDIKIEWAEELGWGNTVAALQSGRVDAICTSFWQNPVEGRYLSFTLPLFYSGVSAYVRADDTRFDGNIAAANTADIKVSASDGNIAYLIAGQDFPQARVVSMPNMTDETLQLMEVMTGKADITFIETYLGEKFNKENGSKLKNLAPHDPLRVFGNTVALPPNDAQLKTMLDSAFVQILHGGFVERTLKKYEEVPGGIFRVARPYQ